MKRAHARVRVRTCGCAMRFPLCLSPASPPPFPPSTHTHTSQTTLYNNTVGGITRTYIALPNHAGLNWDNIPLSVCQDNFSPPCPAGNLDYLAVLNAANGDTLAASPDFVPNVATTSASWYGQVTEWQGVNLIFYAGGAIAVNPYDPTFSVTHGPPNTADYSDFGAYCYQGGQEYFR